MSSHANVLITGASSGFGLLSARTLAAQGDRVFATMRDVNGKNAEAAASLRDFGAGMGGTIDVLELDVTSESSVEAAVAGALETAGRLDVVVNNAGIGVGGYAETFSTEQYQQVFDVNVMGVQRVNRAVLPSMRAAGSGLLLHVSSVMGRVVIPFSGPYTSSKWAVEGLAESYRYELAGSGVEVSIVEPGGFVTGFGDRIQYPADQERVQSYGEQADAPEQLWSGMFEALQSGGPDPQLVADAIAEIVRAPQGQRPLRVVVDPFMGGEGARLLNRTSDEIQAGMLESMGMSTSVATATS